MTANETNNILYVIHTLYTVGDDVDENTKLAISKELEEDLKDVLPKCKINAVGDYFCAGTMVYLI